MFLNRYIDELATIWMVYSRQAPTASKDSGVARFRQLWELLVLRTGSGKLTPEDYYKLRLYRKELRLGDKLKYVSNQAMPPALVGRWKIVADDKLLTYSILSDSGIATPAVYAIYHRVRSHGRAIPLRSPSDVAGYLRAGAAYPIILKPIRGIYSRDVMLLESFDPTSDRIRLAGDGMVEVDEIANSCAARISGYLFQELLHPHQWIRESISDRLCTLRIIVVIEENQPRLMMAVWKIAADTNVADNYWREGNLLPKLDQQTGEILRCSTGLGPAYRLVERHPRTGLPLAGFRVPFYAEAVELALQASRAFCDIPVQAWDIAVTDKGPVPLEVNVVGSLFIPQIVNQEGLLTDGFRDLVEAYRRVG